MMVLFDTGSSNLWVLSARHRMKNLLYPHTNMYDPSKSTEYKEVDDVFKINYVTGSASGRLGCDKLWVRLI